MAIGLITHPIFSQHEVSPGHPERPARLTAIRDALVRDALLDRMRMIDAQPVPADLLARVHDPEHIARVKGMSSTGGGYLDSPDCPMCPLTYEAAIHAAGAGVTAVDAVMAGRLDRAFCLVRPPGHHAERDRAMGFCFFNNIAVAAERLIAHHGLSRVVIVDFDVHHGNGTQHLLEERADVLFVSMHEDPRHQYPGTGWATERGRGVGQGMTLNIPMLPGADDAVMQELWTSQVRPVIEAYQPEFVLVSAGFDAAAGDLLGHLSWSPDGYAWLTRELCELADRYADRHLVSMLEGGYHLDRLGLCAAAHVGALLGDLA